MTRKSEQNHGDRQTIEIEGEAIRSETLIPADEAEVLGPSPGNGQALATTPADEPNEDLGPRRIERNITPKTFLPGKDLNWAKRAVLDKPKGTVIPLGLVAGEARGFERVTNEHQGKKLESVAIYGSFDAISLDGEIIAADANTLYLNALGGDAFARAFTDGGGEVKAIRVDLEIALIADPASATGYAYGIWSHGSLAGPQRIKREVRAAQEARRLAGRGFAALPAPSGSTAS